MNNIELKVNGIDYRLKIEPWRTLVEVLRENLGLMGTKKPAMRENAVLVR